MNIVTNIAAAWLAGELGEGRERNRDLGPAPIGSDPWLLVEVHRALARDAEGHLSPLVVEVTNAVVTIRGAGPAEVERVERAAQTVQGIKALHVETRPSPGASSR